MLSTILMLVRYPEYSYLTPVGLLYPTVSTTNQNTVFPTPSPTSVEVEVEVQGTSQRYIRAIVLTIVTV